MAGVRNRDSGFCSINLLKWALHIVNILFLMTGCALVGVGIWTIVDRHDYISLLTSFTYPMAAYVILAAGILAVIVTLVGCFGIHKELRRLILMYIFSVLFIFLLEAMVGIVSYVYQGHVKEELKMNLNQTFLQGYYVNSKQTEAIDRMQLEYKCCGAERFEDWVHSVWYHEVGKNDHLRVPHSCCKSPSANCGRRDHPSNIYYRGCISRFASELKSHSIIVGAVGLGLCVLPIFGMIFSCCLYIKLKDPRLRLR